MSTPSRNHAPAFPDASASLERKALKTALRHCSPEVFAAACAYRRTHDRAAAATVVLGIIERFTPGDRRAVLRNVRAPLRLQDDLGLDSLALLEILSLIEDVFAVRFADDTLRAIETVGDLLAVSLPTGRRRDALDTIPDESPSRDDGLVPRTGPSHSSSRRGP